jgi:N-glycosylase/DNA lyase
MVSLTTRIFRVVDYCLQTTLTSGQTFRWKKQGETWESIIAERWIRLQQMPDGILATAVAPCEDWSWLVEYLQLEVDLEQILQSFPKDPLFTAAVSQYRGLRLVRQPHWECLASFILSSTKRIPQIEQVVDHLCNKYGADVPTPADATITKSFPHWRRIAELSESALRDCRMGFRAPLLLGTAKEIAEQRVDLVALEQLPLDKAREELEKLPGVGRKIADCTLLFSYGFPQAFPIDVWIRKALLKLYFMRKRNRSIAALQQFTATYFGPHAGYAQQYLFNYVRNNPHLLAP